MSSLCARHSTTCTLYILLLIIFTTTSSHFILVWETVAHKSYAICPRLLSKYFLNHFGQWLRAWVALQWSLVWVGAIQHFWSLEPPSTSIIFNGITFHWVSMYLWGIINLLHRFLSHLFIEDLSDKHYTRFWTTGIQYLNIFTKQMIGGRN